MKYAILLLLLAACSTPQTYLKNPKTQQLVMCGGSTPYGIINYHVQKGADEDCVNTYKANGFRVQ